MCSLNAGGPEDRCGCAPREGEQTSCSRCVQVATDLAPVRLVGPDLRLLSQRLGTPFGDGEPEPGAPLRWAQAGAEGHPVECAVAHFGTRKLSYGALSLS